MHTIKLIVDLIVKHLYFVTNLYAMFIQIVNLIE